MYLPNIDLDLGSIGAFEMWRHLANISSNYQDNVYNLMGKVAAFELQDAIDFTHSANSTELATIAAFAGASYLIIVTGTWKIYKRLSRPKARQDSLSKKELLRLMKKADIHGCAETIKQQLIKRRIDINSKISSSGLTYFLWGCLSGSEHLIRDMINLGADINDETVEGDSALYLSTYAVLHSTQTSTDVLRLLIQAGCNVNKQNRRGYTPLHRAASKGNIKVIQYLLTEGADPYIANHAGVYPIDSAVCSGHIEAAKLLKLMFPNPHVWDVVEPHTPPHIQMGLQSPQRKLMVNSAQSFRSRKILT